MYKKMYHILFNAITDAMEKLEWQDHEGALSLLEKACLDAEEIYMMQAPEVPETLQDATPPIRCPLWCLQNGSLDSQNKLARLILASQEAEEGSISE